MISKRMTIINTADQIEFSVANSHIDTMTGGIWWNGTEVYIVVEAVGSDGETMLQNPGGVWTTFIDGGISHTGSLTWDPNINRMTGRLTMTDTTWGDTSAARYLRVRRNGIEIDRMRYYYYTDIPNNIQSYFDPAPTSSLNPGQSYTTKLNLRDRFGQLMQSNAGKTGGAFQYSATNATITGAPTYNPGSYMLTPFQVASNPQGPAVITANYNGSFFDDFTAPVVVPISFLSAQSFVINNQGSNQQGVALNQSGKVAGDFCVVVFIQSNWNNNTYSVPAAWSGHGGTYYNTANRYHGVVSRTYTGGGITLAPATSASSFQGYAGIAYWFRGGTKTVSVQNTWAWTGNKSNRSGGVSPSHYYIDSHAIGAAPAQRQLQNTQYTSEVYGGVSRPSRLSASSWSSGWQNGSTRTLSMTGSGGTTQQQSAITFYVD